MGKDDKQVSLTEEQLATLISSVLKNVQQSQGIPQAPTLEERMPQPYTRTYFNVLSYTEAKARLGVEKGIVVTLDEYEVPEKYFLQKANGGVISDTMTIDSLAHKHYIWQTFRLRDLGDYVGLTEEEARRRCKSVL